MAKFLLTSKQQAVFDFVQQYIAQHRKSPFVREIQLACQIVSYKSTLDRLNALERKGYLKRTPNKHRGIRLPRKSPATATASIAREGVVV